MKPDPQLPAPCPECGSREPSWDSPCWFCRHLAVNPPAASRGQWPPQSDGAARSDAAVGAVRKGVGIATAILAAAAVVWGLFLIWHESEPGIRRAACCAAWGAAGVWGIWRLWAAVAERATG
jgi:hypothetical protein